jgi:tetratricopeptide (TPR) repeat protein
VSLSRAVLAVALVLGVGRPWQAAVAAPAPAPPATIKDLDKREVDVQPDPPRGVDAAKTMESYKRFLDLGAGEADLRAEALRRLGDLHLESSESARIEQELVSNEGLRATEAIALYGALLKTYPGYERNDSVLYQLARAYELNAEPAKALATLDRLVAGYPHSRYLDEAQFRRGELLFSSKSYAAAESAYQAVIGFGRSSPFYNQSLYKHGWALFKQGDDHRSLESFAGVLDSVLLTASTPPALIDIETLSRPNRELVEDTFRVMAITFSYVDGAKSIDQFLAGTQPRPYAYLLYSRLGDLYAGKERYTDAADSYRAFVLKDRNNEKAPLLQMQAIEAYGRGGFPELVLKGKQEFVEDYSFGTAYWQGRDPKQETKVVAELKTNLKDLAQHFHAQAQKTRSVPDYQEAAKWYRDELTSFPDDPDSAVTNYLLADTLFESRQYAEAAQEYERTAYGYPRHDKASAAGYAAIVAYGKQEDAAPAAGKAAAHAAGIASSLEFADAFPEHPESATVLTRAATDLYGAKDYARAVVAADKLLARDPPVDAAKQRIAWTVIANSAFEQGAFGRAESAYGKAQALMPANDPERPAIVERLAASIYKQGEAKNAAGDTGAAVDDFLRVAALAPTSKVRANADFDAAALLLTAQQWPRAIEVLEGFRQHFPDSPLQPDVTRKLAVAYAESDQPGAAALEFERIAAAPTEGADVQREATLQSADLYEKAGNDAQARAMLESFVKRFPLPLNPAMDARNRLRAMAEKSGDRAAQEFWLKDIIAADRAAGAARTDRSRALGAKAMLALAAPARDAFKRVKLVVPLKKSLGEKRKAMEAALKAYTDAADYQVAEVTTAATYESAELYRTLGRDLMASERPRNLSKDELEQYDVLLEEQAFPFEEKAIKLHEINAARAKEGTYDEWVQKSFGALAELNPGRYGKVEVSEQPVDTITGEGGPASAYAEALRLMKAGDSTEAELQFKQLAISYPEDPGPALNLGLLYVRGARLTEAETAFRGVLEHAPDNPVANDELGVLLRKSGKFGDAEAAYRTAIAAQPDDAAAHLNLGVLYDLYLGEPQKALAEFERYAELAGESKQVAGWLAELRKRVGAPAAAKKETG